MASRSKHQGVISGVIEIGNAEFVEIFDKDYKYLYGEIDDLFVAYGTWVEYTVAKAPRMHPKNCEHFAQNVQYVDVKSSNAPTSDEFRSNDMNVRDYNKVDFFQYDSTDRVLSHKSTIRRDYRRHNVFRNNYYGDVIIGQEAQRRLLEHRIDELDVMMNLIPSDKYKGGPHWEVSHFINQGKCYSLNGYLSIIGKVLRGPGGVVRNRSEVTVAPDALRPRNMTRTFGNAPVGTSGLAGLASRSAPITSTSSEPPNSGVFGERGRRNEGAAAANPFGSDVDDTIQRAKRMSLGEERTENRRGFGRSAAPKPIGLARLSNAHF